MLSVPKVRTYPAPLLQRYHRGAQCGAVAVAAFAVAALGFGLDGVGVHASLNLLAAALAILLLLPAADGAPNRWRGAGYTAAAATLLLGLANRAHGFHLPHAAAEPTVWAICFVVLGASLLLKPSWPRVGVGLDIFTGFVGLLIILERAVGMPTKSQGRILEPAAALAIFALSAAWMAAFPRHRPVSFFLETGSAGALLRRILPLTFLFPVLLVLLSDIQRHTHGIFAQAVSWILILATVGFGVALLWLIAYSLDRMDQQRYLAENDIRSSEERYRLLFENNPQPMWVTDAETQRFLAVNRSATAVYGYSSEAFLQLTLPDIFSGGRLDPAVPLEIDGQLLQHRTRSGQHLEVEAFSHPILWQERSARVAFIHDVTARQQAERLLRESESQVGTLMESTVEGIYAVNNQGECIWCNPAALRQLGLASSADLLGSKVHDLVHHTRADGRPYPAGECEMMLATRRGQSFTAVEELVWRPDGSSFPADVRSSPLLRDGQVIGAVVTFSDVSERKSLQAQFHQAQKMEAVGRLAAGIAHDFNNLLTVINGYTDLLLRRGGDPELIAKIGNIRKAGERAAGLTQQLLAFSRQQVLQPKILDMNAVVLEMEPLLRRVMGEDLTLVTSLAPDLAPVRADPGQLGQVVMNLVVNARDAMPNGGRLTIESSNVVLDAHYAASHPEATPGQYVMLAVTDNGGGMDATTLAHLFEPFFTTKAVGKGTGLGLATVFGIVKQSGGSVAAYSEPGHGTAMKIYLPSLAGAAAAAEAAPDEAVVGGIETVLVVEDEAIVRELLVEILASGGYRVLVAEDPQAAIALSHSQPGHIDLLITDVVMPGMDGRKLAATLAQSRPDMEVLFISGYPDKAISHNGDLDAGLAFIQKPFTPEALTRKVRSMLDRPHPSRSLQAAS